MASSFGTATTRGEAIVSNTRATNVDLLFQVEVVTSPGKKRMRALGTSERDAEASLELMLMVEVYAAPVVSLVGGRRRLVVGGSMAATVSRL